MELKLNRQNLTAAEQIITENAVDLNYYRTVYKTPNANGYKQGTAKFNRLSLASERLLNAFTGDRLIQLAGGIGNKTILPEGMLEKAKLIVCMLIDQQLNDDFVLNEGRTSREYSGGGISYSEAQNSFANPYDMTFEGVRTFIRSSGLIDYLNALEIEATDAGVIFNPDAYLRTADYSGASGTAVQKDNSIVAEELSGTPYVAPIEPFTKDGTTKTSLEYLRFLIDQSASNNKVDGLLKEDNTYSTTLEPTLFKVNDSGNISLDPLIIEGVTFGDGSLVNSQNKAINTASDLPFEPITFFTGDTEEDEKEIKAIVATNVQDAIEEVDSKISVGDTTTLEQANQYTDDQIANIPEAIFADDVVVGDVNWTDKADVTYVDEQIANIPSPVFLDGVAVGDVNWSDKADLTYVNNELALKADLSYVNTTFSDIEAEQLVQNNNITTNAANIGATTQILENLATGEFVGTTTGGTVTEGSWTPIDWIQTSNSFGNITYSGNTFTLTEDTTNLNFFIRGRADNTATAKEVSIRLWDTINNVVIGNIRTSVIASTGVVEYNSIIPSLATGSYRVEITATTGAGTITFTQGEIYVFKFGGGGGATVSKTSELIDDSGLLPDVGLNPKIIKWDGYEATINEKADTTYVDDQLATKANYVVPNGTTALETQGGDTIVYMTGAGTMTYGSSSYTGGFLLQNPSGNVRMASNQSSVVGPGIFLGGNSPDRNYKTAIGEDGLYIKPNKGSEEYTHIEDYIDEKQDKTDNALTTTDKTIVGAINEVNAKPSGGGVTSQIIDDSATEPTLGLNPKLLEIDNKVDKEFVVNQDYGITSIKEETTITGGANTIPSKKIIFSIDLTSDTTYYSTLEFKQSGNLAPQILLKRYSHPTGSPNELTVLENSFTQTDGLITKGYADSLLAKMGKKLGLSETQISEIIGGENENDNTN